MVWHYGSWTKKAHSKLKFKQQFHRTIGNAAIKNGLLVIAEFCGLVHCLDAKTGKRHWTYDRFAGCWGSPLIVEDKIYVGDEDGEIAIFPLTADPKRALKIDKGVPVPVLGEVRMLNAVYRTPIVANNVLFIATRNTLYAISAGGK